jgi:hypothetical protein
MVSGTSSSPYHQLEEDAKPRSSSSSSLQTSSVGHALSDDIELDFKVICEMVEAFPVDPPVMREGESQGSSLFLVIPSIVPFRVY